MIPNWNVFGSYNSFRAFCVTLPIRRMVLLFHTESTDSTENFSNEYYSFHDFCVTLPTRRMVLLFHTESTDSTETPRTANFRDFCDFCVTFTHTPDGFIISHRHFVFVTQKAQIAQKISRMNTTLSVISVI